MKPKVREFYHPLARLMRTKNLRSGMDSRTKIIVLLEKESSTIKGLSEATGMKYSRVLHHLRHLEEEGSAEKLGERKPFKWQLTGRGQRKLG